MAKEIKMGLLHVNCTYIVVADNEIDRVQSI